MTRNSSSWSKWKSVTCLSFYKYDGDNTPVIQGSALGGLNGEQKWVDTIMELMNSVDAWIEEPERESTSLS